MTDEEMAEEYKADYGIDLCCLCRECEVENINPCQHKKDAMYGYKDGFLAGLKAGRPQWHYVKDGVYPTDDKKVLCILGDFENDNLEVGYYSQVEGDSKRWRFENYDLPDDSEEGWGVSAWKEIVMPKEIE